MAAEATPAEREIVARTVAAGETVEVPGRVVRGGHEARSLRHMLLPALAALQSEIGWGQPGRAQRDLPPSGRAAG